MSTVVTNAKQPRSLARKLRWRALKADMRSPYERRQELHYGTAYIGVVEPSADGTYLARAQNGGPSETFASMELAKACLEQFAASRMISEGREDPYAS